MAKKTRRYINHFFAFTHIVALSVPVVVLIYYVVRDNLTNLFASQSVQHHGGTSDVFSNDLDYAVDTLTTKSLDDYIYDTLDNFSYLTYDNIVTNKDEWVSAYEGDYFYEITAEHTSTHLLLNYDYFSLFNHDLTQQNGNIAVWLFMNYYINYLISISILIFLPEVIIYFFDWAKSSIYTFTNVGGID